MRDDDSRLGSLTQADTQPPPVEDPLVGQLIADRYRIEACLGTGGMGAVYRAEHVVLRKAFALKVLHRELGAVAEIVARFEREAVAAGNIDHPNVAKATDFGRLPDGSFYLVMEYVRGRSLADLLQGGPLPLERALRIARQIADGIATAHMVGIVHRDLKPENVMLMERDGTPDFVKILDFGIAKLRLGEAERQPLTQLGTVFGTPDYMAPEQAMGASVDHRADLYALGIILHEMLVGRPPFSGELMELLTQQICAPVPPLPAGVPTPIASLVLALLEKEPDRRPRSAGEVAQRIDDLVNQGNFAATCLPREALTSRPDLGGPERPTDVAYAGATPVAASRRSRWSIRVTLGAAGLAILVCALLVCARSRAPVSRSLARGAFAVSVPPVAATPSVPQGVEPAEPREATTADAPPRRRNNPPKPAKRRPAKQGRKTGPGGIYIPPPSEWF